MAANAKGMGIEPEEPLLDLVEQWQQANANGDSRSPVCKQSALIEAGRLSEEERG